MPFTISAGADKSFHVTKFPPDGHPLDTNATLGACLLFLRLHHPELWPLEDVLSSTQKLSNLLSSPLVTQHASKNNILKDIARCKRNILGESTLEMVAYSALGKLAIVALHVVSPGHRVNFLANLRKISVENLRQIFLVLATIQPHQSFIEYISANITDDQVDKIGLTSSTPSTERKIKRENKRKRRHVRDKQATGSQGSDDGSRPNSGSIVPDPPYISNSAVPDNIAPPPVHQQSPSANKHSHTVNESPLVNSLLLPPGVSQHPSLV